MTVEMGAPRVLAAIQRAHASDLVVAECKDGPTQGGLRILDAFVLRKSWTQLSTLGYEIKVSRSDFLRDTKWTTYRPLVHELYMVCPWKMIDKAEIPVGVGLKYVTNTGRLITKVKSLVEIPEPRDHMRLLYYILMWRATINRETTHDIDTRRAIVEKAEEKKDLADFVGGHVRRYKRQLEDQERELKHEQRRLEFAKRDMSRFTDELRRLGLSWNGSCFDMQTRDDVAKLTGALSPVDLQTLERAQTAIGELVKLCRERGQKKLKVDINAEI